MGSPWPETALADLERAKRSRRSWVGASGAPGTHETTKLSELMHFLPMQEEAWQAIWDFNFVLAGGVRGPGKSYWLRWALLGLLLYYGSIGLKHVRVGLFCHTYIDLQDRQISKIETEFPLWLGRVSSTQEEGLNFFLNEEWGGGRLALRNLDDPNKYKGAEFAAIGVDQLEENTEDVFDKLRGSLRWPGVDRPKFLATANPGGPGNAFVKRLWVDRDFPTHMLKLADQFCFIRGKPKDNPYLPTAYWDQLEAQPDNLRRAWLLGDWDVFEGQAFPSWRYDLHTIPPRAIPDHWPVWGAVDWGYAKPFCHLWGRKDPDTERIFVVREAYQAQLTDRQQARLIKSLDAPNEAVNLRYADPSLWAKKNVNDVVTSTADEYAAEGVVLIKASNDRLEGKRKVDRVLQPLRDGMPQLLVFRTCPNLIRTMPTLAYDKVRPEDVDTTLEDHAYDTLRYLLTGLVPIKTQEKRAMDEYVQRRAQRSPLLDVGDLL